jgi:hypothetical protein
MYNNNGEILNGISQFLLIQKSIPGLLLALLKGLHKRIIKLSPLHLCDFAVPVQITNFEELADLVPGEVEAQERTLEVLVVRLAVLVLVRQVQRQRVVHRVSRV